MTAPQETPARSPLAQHLADALSSVESGNYKDALAIIKEAKALESRNIYVLAFEKQIEQLIEFADLKILTEDQRTDIVESIPGIIERALESTPAELASDVAPLTPRQSQERLLREQEEKSAALEWLKNQYFQHAHEYVRKGEYAHALAEIRRVYIIDPSNRIAKDFERQIEQLISLRKIQTIPKPSQRPPFAPSAAASHERTAVILPAPKPVRVEQRTVSAPPRPAPGEAKQPGKKSMFGRNVVIAIVLTLIALAIAAYYFLGRSGGVKPSAPIGQSLSGETAPVDGSYAPMEAAEQSYVVSLSEKNGNFSTQVIPDSPPPPGSAVASLEDFRPVEEKAAKPAEKQGRSGKGTSGTVKNRASASEERESGGKAEPASPSVQISSPPQTPAGGSITEEARIIRLERPKFGDDSFAAGLEGQVVVQVEIDREGRPRQTRILRSTNDLLNAAVVEGVNKSEFSPRRTSEGAVNSWMTIPFTFRQKK